MEVTQITFLKFPFMGAHSQQNSKSLSMCINQMEVRHLPILTSI